MASILSQKRKHVLWLQWLLFVAVAYLLYFGGVGATSKALGLLLLLSLSAAINIGLIFLPAKYFYSSRFDSILLLPNIATVLLAIYLNGQSSSEFYLFFFIMLIMAAAGQKIETFFLVILTTSGLYALVAYNAGGFSFTSEFLVRIPFLFIVGLFFGYLLYLQKVAQQGLQAESNFTADLFEFGKALAQAEDLPILHSKVPELINEIMVTDACELVIFSQGRMIYRRIHTSKPPEAPLLDISKSIHETTYQSDQVFVSSAINRDPRFVHKEDFHLYAYQHYMGKSWKPGGDRSGLIAVYRHQKERWSEHDIKKFRFLTEQTALGLKYVHVLKEFQVQARTDGLTGLANRRYFYKRTEEELTRACNQSSSLSLVLFDLDNFKSINDSAGHAVGDETLRALATMLKEEARPGDLAGRLGGDEFAVLLPETDSEEAQQFCARLLERIKIPRTGHIPHFSISGGYSTFPHDSATISEFFTHADEALYFAKANGRDCARQYSKITVPPVELPT